MGLGLFIVRSLAQGHGGRVWAENREGGGTRITFALPLRRTRQARQPAPAAAVAPAAAPAPAPARWGGNGG